MSDVLENAIKNRFDVVPKGVLREYLGGSVEIDEIPLGATPEFVANYERAFNQSNDTFTVLSTDKKEIFIESEYRQSETTVMYGSIFALSKNIHYEDSYFVICCVVDGFEFSSSGPIYSLFREETVRNVVNSYFVAKHIESERLLNVFPHDIELFNEVRELMVDEMLSLAKVADEKIQQKIKNN